MIKLLRLIILLLNLFMVVDIFTFHGYADSIPEKNIPTSNQSDSATDKEKTSESATLTVKKEKHEPEAVHPALGTELRFGKSGRIRLVDKLQNFSGQYPRPADSDIASPKSVNIHPKGHKYYINSLEGGKTVVYSLPGLEKLAVISHRFDNTHAGLWSKPSGLFKFRHYTSNLNTFMGKPVESAFSHGGRYLWVPYYRRSFDLNAQDPSALAVIDTKADTIVRVMEAGVLPKMIALSPDGNIISLAHWGDNTVGLIDVSSERPSDWKYIANIAVGHQLFHNFSLTQSVDRDSNTGEALRGTAFTPDSRYVLVGCMGGGGGIAVIDIKNRKYLGKLTGLMPNVRHIAVKGDWLYASINMAGYVQRIPIRKIEEAIAGRGESRTMPVTGWQSVKVGPGARTIVISPRGDLIFAACNLCSQICVVDSSMKMLGGIQADSYPVGLDISPDGRWLISTSQRRNYAGGNCVDIFSLEGVEPLDVTLNQGPESGPDSTAIGRAEADSGAIVSHNDNIIICAVIGVLLIAIIALLINLIRLKSGPLSRDRGRNRKE